MFFTTQKYLFAEYMVFLTYHWKIRRVLKIHFKRGKK